MKNHRSGFLRAHYHWVVAGTLFLSTFIGLGLANNLYSIYLLPVTRSLGIPRSVFALAPSLYGVASLASNLLFGVVYHRLGHRRVAAMALLLNALCYLSYTRAHSMVPFLIGAVVTGLCKSFWSTMGTSRVISDWFHAHNGLVLGVVLAASGLGSSLFSVSMSAITERFHWQTALGASAILLLLAAAAVALLCRDTPQSMGLQPMGEHAPPKVSRSPSLVRSISWEGMSVKDLRRRGYFYQTLAGTLCFCLVNSAVSPTMVAHIQDQGMTAAQAASAQSVGYLALAVAKVLEGALCDRFGAKPVFLGSLGCGLISILMLARVQGPGAAVTSAILMSMHLAVISVVLPMLMIEMFGHKDYSAILGMQMATHSVCVILGAPMMNSIYDWLGTYTPAYYLVAAAVVLSAFLFLSAYRKAAEERKAMQRQA